MTPISAARGIVASLVLSGSLLTSGCLTLAGAAFDVATEGDGAATAAGAAADLAILSAALQASEDRHEHRHRYCFDHDAYDRCACCGR